MVLGVVAQNDDGKIVVVVVKRLQAELVEDMAARFV